MRSIIFPSWDKTFGSTYTLGISSKPEQKQKTKRNSQKKEKSLLSMFLNLERKGNEKCKTQ